MLNTVKINNNYKFLNKTTRSKLMKKSNKLYIKTKN
jgi:hypothetical protein